MEFDRNSLAGRHAYMLENMRQKKGVARFLAIWWSEFWELVKLNLTFLLFCVPVITIPAAITAMNRILIYMIRDEHRFLWHDFVRTFKREFLPATLYGLLLFVPMVLSILSAWYYYGVYQNDHSMIFVFIASVLLLFIVYSTGMYFYPMLAFIELKPRHLLKNAFLLTFIRLPINLIAFVISAAIIVLSIIYLPLSIPVVLLFTFSIAGLVSCMAAYFGLDKYVINESE